MTIKLRSLCKLLVLAMLVLLESCAFSGGNSILLGTNNCKLPCWVDIQPGITTKEDMINTLTAREQSDDGKFTQLESGIAWWQSNDGNNSYFYSQDGNLVSKIEIDFRSTSISLEDVITTFGTPSKLDIGKISDGYFFATIFYPKKGLAFVTGGNKYTVDQGIGKFPIDRNMVVVKGLFLQPQAFSSMLNLLYEVNAVPQVLSEVQDWNGYRVYSE
jgi:hypothetical protein